MCRKDICKKCLTYDPNDHGDYPDAYCTKCWELGASYHSERIRLESEMDAKLDILHVEWMANCNKRGT